MRVLVDCSNYFGDNENQGDKAIFLSLARRIRAMHRGARLCWVTRNPERMRRLLGEDLELVSVGNDLERNYFGAGENLRVIERRRRWFDWRRVSREAQALRIRAGARLLPRHEALLEAVAASDLIFASGGGYFSDAFAQHAIGVLDTLAAGLALKKASVMVGAGFEEIVNGSLVTKAAAILPKLGLIGCRESGAVSWLNRRFGVDSQKITMSGDDAIELANEHRSETPGCSIGVNLRQAEYSAVDDSPLAMLGRILREASERWNAPLLPIPVSLWGPSDSDSIHKIIGPTQGDEMEDIHELSALFQRVARCRIIVTGSYHAAIFGLAQGIPVVALAASLHYTTKLAGLRTEFGEEAVIMVSLSDPRAAEALVAAIDMTWERALALRPKLLGRAEAQIEAGRATYRQVIKCVHDHVRHQF